MIKLMRWEHLGMLYRETPQDQTDANQIGWTKRLGLWRKFAEVVEEEHLGRVLDIGGHIGSWGLLAAREGGIGVDSVLALEPEEESCNLYLANVARNGLQGKIRVLRRGVAGQDGEAVLNLGTESWGHSTHATRPSELNPMSGETQTVPVWSLATLLQKMRLSDVEDVGFMKLNVEGAEFDFIQMARDEDLRRIRHMAVELHFDLVEGSSLEAFLGRLRPAGFRIEVLDDYGGDNRVMVAAHREGDMS